MTSNINKRWASTACGRLPCPTASQDAPLTCFFATIKGPMGPQTSKDGLVWVPWGFLAISFGFPLGFWLCQWHFYFPLAIFRGSGRTPPPGSWDPPPGGQEGVPPTAWLLSLGWGAFGQDHFGAQPYTPLLEKNPFRTFSLVFSGLGTQNFF